MSSYYQQLVDELGAAGAKAYMKSLSAKPRKPGGFAKMDKDQHREISGRGGKAKRVKNQEKEPEAIS